MCVDQPLFKISGGSTGLNTTRQTPPSDQASVFTRLPLKDANRSVVGDEIWSNPLQTSDGVPDISPPFKKQVRI